ncbi:AraC family transcriptional regulator [Alkaliphilus pronyensis]|uniref:AraC family transcriptional regulator n=1 Tax=Alkaliphilus pronyensis TaxID=1482732 RepID=A0A6I0FBE7_9FIRM|nr:AraC family transcriptional regulator [Alkaliphilus pronyensis]KAB3534820.1 AraC family transcriptional regulator [Alkaliphilus pronyensis]
MKPLKQLNQAMVYIEDNLTSQIDFKKVSQLACCSEYHFRRMFSFLSGMSMSQYIRHRRLTQAALELCKTDVKIIDMAVKYGYDSPDSFTRAFQEFHGIVPSEAKKNQANLKAVPPMTFQLVVKGGKDMNYRIVEKEGFYIVGLSKKVKLIYRGINTEIQDMYTSLTEEDYEELEKLSNIEPKGVINASMIFQDEIAEGDTIEHFIGVATTQDHAKKWSVYSVPTSTWAVFTVVGEFPEALQTTWERIGVEWLPLSGYELKEGPQLLWQDENNYNDLSNHKSEIWIPVVKSY